MKQGEMSPELMELVAARFRALGEPARLQILDALRRGEQSVNDLVDETGLGQANVSKHLQILHSLDFVARRKEGLFVYYRLADNSVVRVCDIMCGRIESRMRGVERILRVG
ncbi:MAG: ArsR/SmtB family transcription factor [Gemmatimonadaceae bacterium]